MMNLVRKDEYLTISKNIIVLYAGIFIIFFSQFQPRVFLKIFLKFRKFKLPYSYEILSYKIERVYLCSAYFLF